MKIFGSVFAAIILAGLVLFSGHSMISSYSAWEDRKNAAVHSIRGIQRRLHDYDSFTTSGKSVAELRGAVDELKDLEREELTQYTALGALLIDKPFFGLNEEEIGLRKEVLRHLGPAAQDSAKESPAPEEPSYANDVPRSVILTTDADVYNFEKKVQAIIPAQTKVKVLARYRYDYLVEFNGIPFVIPTGFARNTEGSP